MSLDDYIEDHISEEPEQLARIFRNTCLYHLYPRMCSGHVQGRLLKMLTSMIVPRRILELGAYTGYSTLCMAEGMPADCVLHTVEIDDENEDELRREFALHPAGDRIRLHIGDALDIVPTIDEQWDMVFVDANKRLYVEYLEMILPRMRQGGYILADNTLWGGKVDDPSARPDPQTEGIRRFNDYVARHPALETAIVPVRDGLTILRVADL